MSTELELSDASLMSSYINGDAHAFSAIYNRYSGRVYGYLRNRLPSPEEADEVCQTVFLKFHQSRHLYDYKHPVLQWLYVISKTTLIDHYRKQGRQVSIADIAIEELQIEDTSQVMSHQKGASSLIGKRAEDALHLLPREQREMVERRILQDQTYEEIAKTLNRTEVSVRQTVSRALRKIKQAIHTSEGSEE